MKKIVFIFAALLVSVASHAQFEQGKAYIEASLTSLDISSQAKKFHFGLNARAGYLFMDNVLMRKIGFFGGALMIVATILANLAAFHVYHKATSGNGAIIMPETVTLSTAPREPRDKQEEAFQLQQGTRVEIVDSISDKANGKWLQVSTAGGHKAWLNAKDVEVI